MRTSMAQYPHDDGSGRCASLLQGKLGACRGPRGTLYVYGFSAARGQSADLAGADAAQSVRQLFTDVRWGELDYLIVDLPPGTGDAQLSFSQIAPLTGGVIVTMPQMVSVSDAIRAAAFVQLDVPILGVVENMAGDIFRTAAARVLPKSWG